MTAKIIIGLLAEEDAPRVRQYLWPAPVRAFEENNRKTFVRMYLVSRLFDFVFGLFATI